jgi:hypothetical protein
LDGIGLAVYEEMSFTVKVYGRTNYDYKISLCHFVTALFFFKKVEIKRIAD